MSLPDPAGPSNDDSPLGLAIPDGPWMADVWLIEKPVREVASGTLTCVVTTCDRPAGRANGDRARDTDVLCIAHRRRWRKACRAPDELNHFIDEQSEASPIRQPRGRPGGKTHHPPIDFTLLHPRLSEELRYVAAIKIGRNQWRDPRYVNEVLRAVIRIAGECGFTSLADFRADDGLRMRGRRAADYKSHLGTALPAMLRVLDSAQIDPWAANYWHPANFGLAHAQGPSLRPINWGAVSCDWLRLGLMQLSREHIQARSRAWNTLGTYVRSGSLFSAFMTATRHLEPSEVTRRTFLDFASWVRSENTTRTDIAAVPTTARLLFDLRDRGIVPDLPDTVLMFRGEHSVAKVREPKPFPADTLDAIDALTAREDNELDDDVRLLLRLFRAVGPRVSEALTLPVDCIRHSERGYSLEYFQTKTDGWRRVPLPPLLGADLAAQATWVREMHGPACQWLFPYVGSAPRVNNLAVKAGTLAPWPYKRFRDVVWVAYQRAGITHSSLTGETLRGPHLHRFRHSVATGLLNEGWSQYEVQKFLGHKSPTMMQAYAEIHEDTLRSKYIEFVEKSVDVTGTHHEIDLGGAADVERLRDRLIRTTLPNGYCTLPEKQTCDFVPTPCLSCTAFFRTTPTFLPIHIRQRDESMREIEIAREDGRDRAVRAHEQTVAALDRIIDGLEGASGKEGTP